MTFTQTDLPGAWIIEPEPFRDERGFFARTVCAQELVQRGLVGTFVQSSLSQTLLRGSIRGLHFQKIPVAEAKIVRCIAGAIHDVVVDLRPDSPAFCRYVGIELSAENLLSVYVPRGFAHGFQALTDNAMLHYHISDFHSQDLAAGVRWDDPDIGIAWPVPPTVISKRDRALPSVKERNDFYCLRGL
jgi:dTDP-4-dehydrorhamnose 3,5-epimerase